VHFTRTSPSSARRVRSAIAPRGPSSTSARTRGSWVASRVPTAHGSLELVATYQAAHASPELRATFARIARDETRHAALSHDVHAFLLTKLSPSERRHVAHAYEAALDELVSQGHGGPPEDARAHLGLPTADHASRLARALRDGLDDLGSAGPRATRKKVSRGSSIPARPHVPSA
jgi:hypothetical protein